MTDSMEKKLRLTLILSMFVLTFLNVQSFCLDGIKAKTDPIEVDKSILDKYTGKYTRGDIVLENGQLYQIMGSQKMPMIPLTETLFILDGHSSVRIEFVEDKDGQGYKLIAHFSDGGKEVMNRITEK